MPFSQNCNSVMQAEGLRVLPKTGSEFFYFLLLLATAVIGFSLSATLFWPGIFTPDSLWLYEQAKLDFYNDYQPVLLAWWIHQLNKLYEGTSILFLQNLLFYWAAILIVSWLAFKLCGKFALLIMLSGFFPGCLALSGYIWKDIAYGTSQILVYATLFYVHATKARQLLLRVFIFVLLIFGVGVKTNGLTVLPITVLYWGIAESWFVRKKGYLTAAFVAIAAMFLSWNIVPKSKIAHSPAIQYIQVHDLHAISAKSGMSFFPAYIVEKKGLQNLEEIKKSYGSNNDPFFWGGDSLLTGNQLKLSELGNSWLLAIRRHPLLYLDHRLDMFLGYFKRGLIWETFFPLETYANNWGIKFEAQALKKIIKNINGKFPWVFSPSLFLLLLIIQTVFLFKSPAGASIKAYLIFSCCASWVFILPHFFILPNLEYRYFYFAYLSTLSGFMVLLTCLSSRFFWLSRERLDDVRDFSHK
jgi:hypothetical protein